MSSDDESWEGRFQELAEYKSRNGHLHLPVGSLGRWVNRQRALGKKGRLTPDRTRRLAEVGFAFGPRRDWDSKLRELREYRAGHGTWPLSRHPTLGRWIRHLRKQRSLGKLSDERVDALDKMGFEWDGRAACAVKLEEKPDAADGASKDAASDDDRLDIDANGDGESGPAAAAGRIPGSAGKPDSQSAEGGSGPVAVAGGIPRGTAGRPNSKKFLDPNAQWELRFSELVEYKRRHRHCNVPTRYPPNPPLGHWVDRQRTRRKQGSLPPDQRRRLEGEGFVFRMRRRPGEDWGAMLRELGEYRKRHGRWPPAGHPELGDWIEYQRRNYALGKLSAQQFERLEEMGFEWDGRARAVESSEEKCDAAHVARNRAASENVRLHVDGEGGSAGKSDAARNGGELENEGRTMPGPRRGEEISLAQQVSCLLAEQERLKELILEQDAMTQAKLDQAAESNAQLKREAAMLRGCMSSMISVLSKFAPSLDGPNENTDVSGVGVPASNAEAAEVGEEADASRAVRTKSARNPADAKGEGDASRGPLERAPEEVASSLAAAEEWQAMVRQMEEIPKRSKQNEGACGDRGIAGHDNGSNGRNDEEGQSALCSHIPGRMIRL